MIGETLPAGGAPVEVTLALKGGGSVDAVEIIGDPSGEPGVVARGGRADLERTGDDLVFRAEVPPADRAYYLRARGCGRAVKPVVGEAGTMWFYTNALRVEPAARGG